MARTLGHGIGARERNSAGGPQPIPNLADDGVGGCPMNPAVLSGNVRQAFLRGVRLALENHTLLVTLTGPEPLRAEKQAQFERHVEAGHARGRIKARVGEIVDGPSAAPHDADDLVDANFPTVFAFAGTTRPEPAIHHSKDISAQSRAMVRREGAVYEDGFVVSCAVSASV